MNSIGKNTPAATSAGEVTMQAALWNSIKMLVAAILCGLAVSIAAAGIAIVLSSEAEAKLLQQETNLPTNAPTDENDAKAGELSAGPGTLLAGDGCNALSLPALERDWQVRIDGNRVEVRVMQSFQLNAEVGGATIFQVQLPVGARLRRLSAHTADTDLPGHVVNVEQYERLAPAEYLELTRNRLLVTHTANGSVTTSPIMNIRPKGIVTVQYVYEVTAEDGHGFSFFSLPMETSGEHSTMNQPDISENQADLKSPGAQVTTKGALWVEWLGRNPRQVWGVPAEATFEMSKSRIAGFSWMANDILPGTTLQLGWSLQGI